MTLRRLLAFFSAAALLLGAVASAQQNERSFPYSKETFQIPERYTLVNDYTNELYLSTATRIAEKLQALERRNGTQIVILIVPSIGDEGVMEYSQKVLEKWDIGNNGQGNGVLFFMAQEGAVIRTGPGIAGALPDAKLTRIFRETIEPYWERGELSEGIETGVDELIKAAWDEETAPTFYIYRPFESARIENALIVELAAFGVIYAGVLLYRRGRRNRGER